jgi:hypothetical protein
MRILFFSVSMLRYHTLIAAAVCHRYQTLTNLGTTLAVNFPDDVEVAIAYVKQFVNIDVFNFTAMSCLAKPSYYSKLWLAVLVPVVAEALIALMFKDKMRSMGLLHLPKGDNEQIARSMLSQTHHKMRSAKKAGKKDWAGGLFRRFKRGGDEHAMAEEEAETAHARAFEHDREMRALYRKLAKRSEMEQAAVGWGFFLIFLAYPSVTNKIFAFFYCYKIDDETEFLMEDYTVSCLDALYYLHFTICVILIIAIPLGIPAVLGYLIFKARKAILEDKGPHYLESLYKDYKPQCCLWEIYQMVQKVTLIGLLTFVDRGSILQCLVGLMICNFVLVCMVKDEPYQDGKTNILAIVGQLIVVLSFLSALLLRVDLVGEAFTVDMIGGVILLANVPMMGFLVWDTLVTMSAEIHAAQIDMIRAELGEAGAKYRCLVRVPIYPKMHHSKESKALGWIEPATDVTGIDTGFTKKGVCRLKIKVDENDAFEGWVNYSGEGGLTAERNFMLISAMKKGAKAGKINFTVRRANQQVAVTLFRAKGLRNMDFLGKNDVYSVVSVNGRSQRSETMDDVGANPVWGEHDAFGKEVQNVGLTFVWDDIEAVESIAIQVYDEDEGDTPDDLIGEIKLPMDEIVDPEREEKGQPWKVGPEWRVVRESTGEIPKPLPIGASALDMEGIDEDSDFANPLSTFEPKDSSEVDENGGYSNPLRVSTFEVEDATGSPGTTANDAVSVRVRGSKFKHSTDV